MQFYKTLAIVKLGGGKLVLTGKQYDARTAQVKLIERGTHNMVLCDIVNGPVNFKVGEVFGYSEPIPKNIAYQMQRVDINPETGEVVEQIDAPVAEAPVADEPVAEVPAPDADTVKNNVFAIFDTMNNDGLLDAESDANKEYLTAAGIPKVAYVNSVLPEGVKITSAQCGDYYTDWGNVE